MIATIRRLETTKSRRDYLQISGRLWIIFFGTASVGPRWQTQEAPHPKVGFRGGCGGQVGNAGSGDHFEDSSGVFRPEQTDQDDLPRCLHFQISGATSADMERQPDRWDIANRPVTPPARSLAAPMPLAVFARQ